MDLWNWLVFYKVQYTHSVRIYWTGKLILLVSSQFLPASKMIIFFLHMIFITCSFISFDLPLFNFTFSCGIILFWYYRKDRRKYDITSLTKQYRIYISLGDGLSSVQDLWSKHCHTIRSGHIARVFYRRNENRKRKEIHSDGKHMSVGFPICLFFIDETSATYYIWSWKRS